MALTRKPFAEFGSACSWTVSGTDISATDLTRGVGHEAQRTVDRDGERAIEMVAIRTRVRVPADFAVPAAQAVADELIAVLNKHDRDVAGPALSMVFSFMLLEFGEHDGDMAKLTEILKDVGEIITKYHAAKRRH